MAAHNPKMGGEGPVPILLGEETAATRGTAVGVGLKQTAAVSIAMTDRSRCGSRASATGGSTPWSTRACRAPSGATYQRVQAPRMVSRGGRMTRGRWRGCSMATEGGTVAAMAVTAGTTTTTTTTTTIMAVSATLETGTGTAAVVMAAGTACATAAMAAGTGVGPTEETTGSRPTTPGLGEEGRTMRTGMIMMGQGSLTAMAAAGSTWTAVGGVTTTATMATTGGTAAVGTTTTITTTATTTATGEGTGAETAAAAMGATETGTTGALAMAVGVTEAMAAMAVAARRTQGTTLRRTMRVGMRVTRITTCRSRSSSRGNRSTTSVGGIRIRTTMRAGKPRKSPRGSRRSRGPGMTARRTTPSGRPSTPSWRGWQRSRRGRGRGRVRRGGPSSRGRSESQLRSSRARPKERPMGWRRWLTASQERTLLARRRPKMRSPSSSSSGSVTARGVRPRGEGKGTKGGPRRRCPSRSPRRSPLLACSWAIRTRPRGTKGSARGPRAPESTTSLARATQVKPHSSACG
mmetsp:Transcript_11061/g.33775  ORF Transcript_11061/g.33775 Transcript_11061/m.33775 type:complete len:520 (-) Transcript_11061:1355-2914(-)